MRTILRLIAFFILTMGQAQEAKNATIEYNGEMTRANLLWEIRQQYKRTMDSCIVVGDRDNLVQRHPYINVLSNLKLKCADCKEDKAIWLFPSGRYYVYHEGSYKWIPVKKKDINQIAKE